MLKIPEKISLKKDMRIWNPVDEEVNCKGVEVIIPKGTVFYKEWEKMLDKPEYRIKYISEKRDGEKTVSSFPGRMKTKEESYQMVFDYLEENKDYFEIIE